MDEKRKYHWCSWRNLSYPYEEGGIGVRMMSDVCKSFQFKKNGGLLDLGLPCRGILSRLSNIKNLIL